MSSVSFFYQNHKVGKVLSIFSSRRNWDSPNPSPAGECAPLLWFRGEGHTRWRERGWDSPNSDEGTYTAVLFIYTYFVIRIKNLFSSEALVKHSTHVRCQFTRVCRHQTLYFCTLYRKERTWVPSQNTAALAGSKVSSCSGSSQHLLA